MNVRTSLLLVSIIVLVSSMIFASQYATIKSGYDFRIVHPSNADVRYIGNDNSSADGICVLRVDGSNGTTATLVLELGDWSVEWNKTYTAAFGIVNEEPFAVNITDLEFTVSSGTYSYLQVWLHGNGSLRAEDDPTSVFMYDNGTVVNDSSTVAWTLGAGDGNPNNISTGSVSINTPWNEDAHVRYSTTDLTAYGVGMAGRTVTNASDYVWVQISVVAESASTHTGIIQPQFEASTEWSSGGVPFGWWNKNWEYRKLITIDHDQVAGNLVNFPVLVSLNADSNLTAHAQPDGDDICFVLYSDNSTQLKHELVSYSSGTLEAWVNVTSLSSTVDTNIWMYYGNDDCDAQEDVPGTWDNHYVGVWHISEGSGSAVRDSTNHFNGTLAQTDHWTASGKVGNAYNFDGVDDAINLGDVDLTSGMTLEVWAFPTAIADNYRLISKDICSSPWVSYDIEIQTGFYYRSKVKTGGSTYETGNPGTNIKANVWKYLVATYDGATNYMYENDSVVLGFNTGSDGDIDANDMDTYIGHNGCGYANQHFKGILDEARISSIARNTNWITTSYNTMNSPSTFFNAGFEQSLG